MLVHKWRVLVAISHFGSFAIAPFLISPFLFEQRRIKMLLFSRASAFLLSLLLLQLQQRYTNGKCGFVGCRYYQNLYQISCPALVRSLIAEPKACGVNTLKLHHSTPLTEYKILIENATKHEGYLKEIITWRSIDCPCFVDHLNCKAKDCR